MCRGQVSLRGNSNERIRSQQGGARQIGVKHLLSSGAPRPFPSGAGFERRLRACGRRCRGRGPIKKTRLTRYNTRCPLLCFRHGEGSAAVRFRHWGVALAGRRRGGLHMRLPGAGALRGSGLKQREGGDLRRLGAPVASGIGGGSGHLLIGMIFLTLLLLAGFFHSGLTCGLPADFGPASSIGKCEARRKRGTRPTGRLGSMWRSSAAWRLGTIGARCRLVQNSLRHGNVVTETGSPTSAEHHPRPRRKSPRSVRGRPGCPEKESYVPNSRFGSPTRNQIAMKRSNLPQSRIGRQPHPTSRAAAKSCALIDG